jgi:hypothetical protein
MTQVGEYAVLVRQFHDSLAKVIELGFGEDECDHVVSVMFDDLARKVTEGEKKRLPFMRAAAALPEQETPVEMIARVDKLLKYAERRACEVLPRKKQSSVIFPFLTTLGVSGGIFLVACHLARLAPGFLRDAGLIS